MTLNFTDFGLTSAIDPTDPTKVTADAQLRVSAMADSLGLIANYTQATNANKMLWSRSDNKENRLLNSNDAENAFRATIDTNNMEISPPASLSGATVNKITEDSTASNSHGYTKANSSLQVIAGKIERFVIFVKRTAGTRTFYLNTNAPLGSAIVKWNPETGALISATGTSVVASAGVVQPDGWVRCEFEVTGQSTSAAGTLVVGLATSAGTTSYSGDGTSFLYFAAHVYQDVNTDPTYLPTTDHPQYAGVNGRRWLVLNGAQAMNSTSTCANIYAAGAKLVYIPLVSWLFSATTYNILGSSGGVRGNIRTISTGFRFSEADPSTRIANSPVATVNQLMIVRGVHSGGFLTVGIDTGAGFVDGTPVACTNGTDLTQTLLLGATSDGFYGKLGGIFTANTGLAKPNFENLLREYYFARSQMIWDPYKADLMLKRPTVIG